MGRVGARLGIRIGLGSKGVFWAVVDFFRLVILEAHGGQTKFPDFHTVSHIIIQNCGVGGSRFPYILLDRKPESRCRRLPICILNPR